MNYLIVVPIIIYLLVLIGFNYYIRYRESRRVGESAGVTNVVQQYSISDRKLPALALAMTSASTYASASSFIGGPGSAYFYGIGWVVLAMIQVPTMWFVFMLLGKRLNQYASEHNVSTINDILYARYKSKLLVAFASIILVIAFITSIVVQFIGAARLLQGALGIEYQ